MKRCSTETSNYALEIPALADYLRVELNEFFRAHQCVGMEMAKQREKENT